MSIWIVDAAGIRWQVARLLHCPQALVAPQVFLAVSAPWSIDPRVVALRWACCAAFGDSQFCPVMGPVQFGGGQWNPVGALLTPNLYGVGPLH